MASDLPRPTTRTASRCTPQIARGTHTFDIAEYSLHRGLGAGNFIRSAAFDVGGYSWSIRFYPDGYVEDGGGDEPRDDDTVAAFLELLSKNAVARAHFDIRLVDQATGLSTSFYCTAVPQAFDTTDAKEETPIARGWDEFARTALQEFAYLCNDRIVIECDVTVFKEPQVDETIVIDAPALDRSSDFGKLLDREDLADVMFLVNGEVFIAHKAVLAVRSPTLLEDYISCDLTWEQKECIWVNDVNPSIFMEVLRFIYTDTLPDLKLELVKELLMAADRHSMERLKVACEGVLCKSIDHNTVATMLAFADYSNCDILKDACFRYIDSSIRAQNKEAGGPEEQPLQRSVTAIVVDLWEKARKLGASLFSFG
jgi:speckle-type POZ protein